MTPSITQDAINDALCNFIMDVTGLPEQQVIVGQINRVASPLDNYVVVWPLRRPRLATNVDTPADAKFIGSIAGLVMTVTEVVSGAIPIQTSLFGPGVAAGNRIVAQQSGPEGGAGEYLISKTQGMASATLSAGTMVVKQSTETVMQVDVHGKASGENVQTIATLFRDEYGVRFFEGTGITPLFCDDPRQMPFTTAAKQYEDRWTLDVHLQFKPTIATPQEFADTVVITAVEVSVIPIGDGNPSADFSDPDNSQFVPGLI